MSKKKEVYIEYELAFLERKLEELEEYIEDRPFSELKDRMDYKETRSGGVIKTIIASIEVQRKDITQAIKDYAEIAQTIRTLRREEELKESKGDRDIPARMR